MFISRHARRAWRRLWSARELQVVVVQRRPGDRRRRRQAPADDSRGALVVPSGTLRPRWPSKRPPCRPASSASSPASKVRSLSTSNISLPLGDSWRHDRPLDAHRLHGAGTGSAGRDTARIRASRMRASLRPSSRPREGQCPPVCVGTFQRRFGTGFGEGLTQISPKTSWTRSASTGTTATDPTMTSRR